MDLRRPTDSEGGASERRPPVEEAGSLSSPVLLPRFDVHVRISMSMNMFIWMPMHVYVPLMWSMSISMSINMFIWRPMHVYVPYVIPVKI